MMRRALHMVVRAAKIALIAISVHVSPAFAATNWQADDLKSSITSWSLALVSSLQREDFSELELRLKEARYETPRIGDGQFLLPLFYDALVDIRRTAPRTNLDIHDDRWPRLLSKWSNMYPASAAPYILQARLFYAKAWRNRGHGFAASVSAVDNAAYEMYLAQALEYLRKNAELASTDPEYYALLARIEFQVTGNQDVLFERASEALIKFPGYVQIFQELASYLLPIWQRQPQLFSKWVDWAVQAGAKSDGTGLLARIYWTTNGGWYAYKDIREMGAEWPRLKRAFADEMQHFPHWVSVSRFLTMACKANDTEQAALLFGSLQLTAPNKKQFVGTPDAYCVRISKTN